MTSSCPCTVALCTRDRSDALRDVLADVIEQAPEGARIVVIDQSTTPDDTAAWIASMVGAHDALSIVYEPMEGGGLPASRNRALALAEGPVVIFFDDDARLHAGCVTAHLAAYADSGVGAVVGRIVERSVATNAAPGTCRIDLGGRARTHLDSGDGGDVESLKGANMSFRRLALAGIGGFDDGYTGTAFLEEADLAARVLSVGWRLRFVPEAAVDHLSLPSGGCRALDREEAELARFHNTGRWIARHRPWSVAVVWSSFTAIAARRAVEWGDPRAVRRLLAALAAGLRS